MSRNAFGPQTVVALPVRSAEPVTCRTALGRVAALDAGGGPLVTLDGAADPLPRPADATVLVSAADIGSAVTLLVASDGRPPIITGVVQRLACDPLSRAAPTVVTLDGESLVFEAQREIVLRCGKSSLTLTRDGKVVLRGTDLLEASSGSHRIRGATVEIN
jgi:hypothetical protein